MRAPRLTPTRSLGLLIALTCIVLFTVPRYGLLDDPVHNHVARGVRADPPAQSDSVQPSSAAAPTSASPSPTSTAAATTTPSSSPLPTSSAPPQTSSTPPPTTSAPPQTSAPPPTDTGAPASSGAPPTLTVTNTIVTSDAPTSSSSTSASPTSAADNNNSGNNSGISTSTIIGLSVAGGVAVLVIIAFFVWKFTRKRFSDLDDNEAIKWPELNTHGGEPTGVPLPVNRTGGAGFDTGPEADRGYAGSIAATSTTELYPGGADPYAVPPLPHLNPNQPYRDDPNEQFYDPYRGPIPQTFDGEAIPMTQLAGRRSPGPGAAYDPGVAPQAGRQSPGPQAAYGYGGDPAAGRASPGPQAAYAAGRASPGPQAYAAGRASPGPQAAYNYGPR
ncbi:hypothetical protein FA95DRAFT_1562543 [Auriscalpium vulgare]|uniref:Uncharacterized protein n=1 Tax=Auriscalpium vulgare TaxID=40419 RepID=A0ACB8RKL1_9AGAM|nr:hypothetical protein FA95DRAFT_1562543 [Auriscalpium vulgare]